MYGVKKFSLVSAAFGLTMLAACGDENTTEVTEQTGIAMLEAGKAMPECNSESAGNMVYSTDSAAVYYCAEGMWQTLNGKDGAKGENGDAGVDGKNGVDGKAPEGKNGESCSAKASEDGKSYTISCPGSEDIVIKNGEDGKIPEVKDGEGCSAKTSEDGKSYTISCPGSEDVVIRNGEDGKSAYELSGYEGSVAEWIASQKGGVGKNCAIEEAKDGEKVIGYKVTCGEDSKTILNGADGKDSGAGCTAEDLVDGKVVVTCGEGDSKTEVTLYKAMCDFESYDPVEAFCFEGKIYDRCGAQIYNPNEESCYKDEIYSCGNKPYDPAEQYCLTLEDGNGVEKKTVEELLIDSRDEANVQVYKTVKICDDNGENCQIWMAENLNYGGVQSWCGGGNGTTEGDCSKYGRLYTWRDAAVVKAGCGSGSDCENSNEGVQGVCPQGWHLPSYDEFGKLINFIDPSFEYNHIGEASSSMAGKLLKSKVGWNSNDNGTSGNGTDTYGFSALPGGSWDSNGDFYIEGDFAYFWLSSETEEGSHFAYYLLLDREEGLSFNFGNKTYAMSVRCIKDKANVQ